MQPPRSPNDPGIPEARESAAARLDDVVARVVFSADATVLGEERTDRCDFARAGWFGSAASEYHCVMRWSQEVVFPHAHTRSEVAVALDAEIAHMDFTLSTGAVRELVATHPEFAADSRLYIGGHIGDVRVGFATEPRESDHTTHVVEAQVQVEYWNEEALPDLDALEPQTPDFSVWQSAYGDKFLFDLAQPEPTDAVDACLDDPAVAAHTVVRHLDPFPRVTFELSAGSRFEEAGRVRDCFAASLTSGTLAWYEPFTGRGTTEVPARDTAVPSPTTTEAPAR